MGHRPLPQWHARTPAQQPIRWQDPSLSRGRGMRAEKATPTEEERVDADVLSDPLAAFVIEIIAVLPLIRAILLDGTHAPIVDDRVHARQRQGTMQHVPAEVLDCVLPLVAAAPSPTVPGNASPANSLGISEHRVGEGHDLEKGKAVWQASRRGVGANKAKRGTENSCSPTGTPEDWKFAALLAEFPGRCLPNRWAWSQRRPRPPRMATATPQASGPHPRRLPSMPQHGRSR